MTVRLPRRYPSEDQDTFLERILSLLENIVDTVKDGGVFWPQLVKNSAVKSAETFDDTLTLDVLGTRKQVKSVDIELIGGNEVVGNLITGFACDASGSGEARVEVSMRLTLTDSSGTQKQSQVVEDFYIKAGDTGFNTVLTDAFVVMKTLEPGIATLKIEAKVSKNGGNASLDLGEVRTVSGYINELRR